MKISLLSKQLILSKIALRNIKAVGKSDLMKKIVFIFTISVFTVICTLLQKKSKTNFKVKNKGIVVEFLETSNQESTKQLYVLSSLDF